jgi:uncharacterized protein YcgL (UPF0745 family)
MDDVSDTLPCWVYRSRRKADMYLYLSVEDSFDDLPGGLLERFGRPELVMRLELSPGRRLAREKAETVLRNLRASGYHLQLPPRLEPDLYRGD